MQQEQEEEQPRRELRKGDKLGRQGGSGIMTRKRRLPRCDFFASFRHPPSGPQVNIHKIRLSLRLQGDVVMPRVNSMEDGSTDKQTSTDQQRLPSRSVDKASEVLSKEIRSASNQLQTTKRYDPFGVYS